jgi:hypothetical protein
MEAGRNTRCMTQGIDMQITRSEKRSRIRLTSLIGCLLLVTTQVRLSIPWFLHCEGMPAASKWQHREAKPFGTKTIRSFLWSGTLNQYECR